MVSRPVCFLVVVFAAVGIALFSVAEVRYGATSFLVFMAIQQGILVSAPSDSTPKVKSDVAEIASTTGIVPGASEGVPEDPAPKVTAAQPEIAQSPSIVSGTLSDRPMGSSALPKIAQTSSFVSGASNGVADGIYARLQVGYSLETYTLDKTPDKIYLEVGANSRDILMWEPKVQRALHKGAFILSFEPLLDKYAFLMHPKSNHGTLKDWKSPLGMQHQRGVGFPIAVGCQGNATFHIADTDGCSSLMKMNGGRGDVDAKCSTEQEARTVPCLTLEEVIRDWLQGRSIHLIKTDAQGFDLSVIKSAGSMMDRLNRVHMEARCDGVAPLYTGQPNCSFIYGEMVKLGFIPQMGYSRCRRCLETDLDFKREPIKNSAPVGSADANKFATVQVARWPLWKYYTSDKKPPSELWLEVGVDSSASLQLSSDMKAAFERGAFLLTFEPFVAKYTTLLRKHGGKKDTRAPLGMQHDRGLVFPFAVGCQGTMTALGNEKSTSPRTLPCISLQEVIGDWVAGQHVKHLRIDGHMDVDIAQVVKSAGSMLDRIESIGVQTYCNFPHTDVVAVSNSLSKLGFTARFELKSMCSRVLDFSRTL